MTKKNNVNVNLLEMAVVTYDTICQHEQKYFYQETYIQVKRIVLSNCRRGSHHSILIGFEYQTNSLIGS